MRKQLFGLAVGFLFFLLPLGSFAGDITSLEKPDLETIEVEVSDTLLDDVSAGFYTPALSDAGSKIILWDENGRASDLSVGGGSGTFIEVNEY